MPNATAPTAEQLYYRGLDLLAENDPAAAVEVLHQSVAADPTLLDALHALVRALRDCGRLEEALPLAHRLIAINPYDALAHTCLSIVYQHQGLIAEAEAAATQARLLDWKHQLLHGTPPTEL